ncbi:MAG: S8 family serine peptidase [Frankiaceae bacterium]|jgi:type VII secretion-associated serine protease mycosin|nr:S8 family serine peptidase [Frankiaceae bacterium]
MRRARAAAITILAALLALALPAAPIAPGRLPAARTYAAGCTVAPGQPESASPWAASRLKLDDVHVLTGGAGVTVAVIDSGLNAGSHPQLTGMTVVPGVNVMAGATPADTSDCTGHGTAVAGIIAAQPLAGVGFAGIAPAAAILPIKQSSTDRDGTAAGIAAGIRAALARGARVINISITVASDDPDLRAAVAEAEAADAVVVAAAGNTSDNCAPCYPAAYPTVLGVAASTSADAIASYSVAGDYVDIAAPGDDVATPATFGGFNTAQQLTRGTSFAAPFVSGTAALVISAATADHQPLSAAQVRNRLEATADSPGLDVPDPHYGYGILNPWLAVTAVGPEAPAPNPADSAQIAAPPIRAPADRSARDHSLILGAALVALAATVLLTAAATRSRLRAHPAWPARRLW